MAGHRLTEEQVARICALREKGCTIKAIAEEIGCSAGAVYWRCLENGVEPPKPARLPQGIVGPPTYSRGGHTVRRFTPDEDARLLKMEAEGLSRAVIARALKRGRNSIVGRLMTLARHDERQAEGRGKASDFF